MPKAVGTSSLASIAGQLSGVFQKRKGTEAAADSGARLPAGISGVAQVKTLRIAPVKTGQNAGKLQFYADAVIKEPPEHAGIPVRGLLTRQMVALYDTPGREKATAADHYEQVMDLVARLQGKKEIDDSVAPTNIEATLAALQAAKPHIHFRTWQGRKQVLAKRADGKWALFDEDEQGNRTPSRMKQGMTWSTEEAARKANPYAGRDPLVNEVWGAPCSYNGDTSETAGVESGEASGDEGGDEHLPDETAETTEAAEAGSGAEDIDLDALAGVAAGEGKEAELAEAKFLELAAAAGIDEEAVRGADSWQDVVAMLQEAAEGAEGEGEEEVVEESEPPKKGDAVDHEVEVTVLNKKTKKKTKQKRKVACEVVTVNAKAETVTLKNLDDGKTLYRDVPWSDLNPE